MFFSEIKFLQKIVFICNILHKFVFTMCLKHYQELTKRIFQLKSVFAYIQSNVVNH